MARLLDALDLARRGGVPSSDQETVVRRKIVAHMEKVWDTEGLRHLGVACLSRVTTPIPRSWRGSDLTASSDDHGETGSLDLEKLSRFGKRSTTRFVVEGWNEGLGTFTQHYGGQDRRCEPAIAASGRLSARG